MSDSPTQSLRERKKAQTRKSIQEHALRLFLGKGYDATTVEEIAAAAGVSHMTFFRYFPTKEDVVLADEYDPLLFEKIAGRPPEEPAIERVRHAVADGLKLIYAVDAELLLRRTRLILGTPQLRARLWEQQIASEGLIVHALSRGRERPESALRLRVVAATCLTVIVTAALEWIESNGKRELPDLIDEVFETLYRELGGSHVVDDSGGVQ
jgi:AcrR family transcriptional regulator